MNYEYQILKNANISDPVLLQEYFENLNEFAANSPDFAVHPDIEQTFNKIYEYFNSVAYEYASQEDRLNKIENLLVFYTGKKLNIFTEYKKTDIEVEKKDVLGLLLFHLIVFVAEERKITPKELLLTLYENTFKEFFADLISGEFELFSTKSQTVKIKALIDNSLYNIKKVGPNKESVFLLIFYLIVLDAFENFF